MTIASKISSKSSITREDLITHFLEMNGYKGAKRERLTADASFRKYERIFFGGKQFILMDAPPPQENVTPFLYIARLLKYHGFNAPEIILEDKENGLLLLEDFGDHRFSRLLSRGYSHFGLKDESFLYQRAMDVLVSLHQRVLTKSDTEFIPNYNLELYTREVALLLDWYLPKIVGIDLKQDNIDSFWKSWNTIFNRIDHITTKPVLVLRDYHVDNLMWLQNREKDAIASVGLLDFQDAVMGHAAYDIVSLLEDARREVSPALADEMLNYYFTKTRTENKSEFLEAYAILGAQRNTKIIGIFSRLALRDNKPVYLPLIKRVWRYLEKDLEHPALREVKNWMDSNIPNNVRDKEICL